jgi:hypothetical protein
LFVCYIEIAIRVDELGNSRQTFLVRFGTLCRIKFRHISIIDPKLLGVGTEKLFFKGFKHLTLAHLRILFSRSPSDSLSKSVVVISSFAKT